MASHFRPLTAMGSTTSRPFQNGSTRPATPSIFDPSATDQDAAMAALRLELCKVYHQEPHTPYTANAVVQIYLHAGQASAAYMPDVDKTNHQWTAIRWSQSFLQLLGRTSRRRLQSFIRCIFTDGFPKINTPAHDPKNGEPKNRGIESTRYLWAGLQHVLSTGADRKMSGSTQQEILAGDPLVRYYRARLGQSINKLHAESNRTKTIGTLKEMLETSTTADQSMDDLLIALLHQDSQRSGVELLSRPFLEETKCYGWVAENLGIGVVIMGDDIWYSNRARGFSRSAMEKLFQNVRQEIQKFSSALEQVKSIIKHMIRRQQRQTPPSSEKVLDILNGDNWNLDQPLTLEQTSKLLDELNEALK